MSLSRVLEALSMALKAILANRLRSSLTMLGVIIGVAAVIALIAVGNGASSEVTARLSSLGTNLLSVSSGNVRGARGLVRVGFGSQATLTEADYTALQQLPPSLVTAVVPVSSTRSQVVAGSNNMNTSIVGTTSEYATTRNVEIAEGRFLTTADNRSTALVAVLGSDAKSNLFPKPYAAVGQTVMISGLPFKVIGVAQATGGFGLEDAHIYIPIDTLQAFLGGNRGAHGYYLQNILVQAKSAQASSAAQQAIETTLLRTHRITGSAKADADFSVTSQASLLSTLSSVVRSFTILLASVAAISLLVGGIGIMNIMLVSVTERTREIGVRMAVGATPGDIRTQFLIEAVVLSLVGGLTGALVGIGVAYLVQHFTGMPTPVSLGPLVLALSFAVAVGLIFGYWPAYRASQLDPIEALRYE